MVNGAIEIGNVRKYRSLAVAPIYSKDSFKDEVVMIDDAMKTGMFSVTETGTVSKLNVKNDLDSKVFITCGSLVEGASQNRYSIYPSLIMPHTSVQLPVNCAEQRQGLVTGLRGRYNDCTTIVMPTIRGGHVEQDIAWTQIMNTTTILSRLTPTRDYSFAEKNTNIDDYLSVIGKARDCQIGIVAGIKSGEDCFFYTDFFGNNNILRRVHPKLSRSFGIAAKVHEGNADSISVDDIVKFLRSLEEMKGKRKSNVGGGELYVLESPVKGSILAYQADPVQVTMRRDWESN